MEEIARGREAIVYALDSRRVLRRDITNRPLGSTAELTEYLRSEGYPVPAVYEVDGRDVIMERIHGPDLLGLLAADPSRLEFVFRMLGDLSNQLSKIPAPEWLDSLPVDPRDIGLRAAVAGIVHLDFHPGNVILAADGPRVIDWSNAHCAPREVDVSFTDLILRTAPEAAAFPAERVELGLAVFAEATGVDPLAGRATACVFRTRDPGLSAVERARIAQFIP